MGEGRLTRELALKFPNLDIEDIDYSERPIQLAKALNTDLNIVFNLANIIQDILPKKYDTSILMEVYEHIEPSLVDNF